MAEKIFWKVTSEDLTHLGGPMGTEYTTVNWVKVFSSKDKALSYIRKDYGKELRDPYSIKGERARWDLGYVGYTLEPLKVDEEVA